MEDKKRKKRKRFKRLEIKKKDNIRVIVREIPFNEVIVSKWDYVDDHGFIRFCNEINANPKEFDKKERERFKEAIDLLHRALYFAMAKRRKLKGMELAKRALKIYPRLQLYSYAIQLYTMVKLHTKFNNWYPSKKSKGYGGRKRIVNFEFGEKEVPVILIKKVKNKKDPSSYSFCQIK